MWTMKLSTEIICLLRHDGTGNADINENIICKQDTARIRRLNIQRRDKYENYY